MTVTEKRHEGPEIAPPGVKLASALGQSVIPANSLTDVGEPRRPIDLRPLAKVASQNRRWLEAESTAETRSDGSTAVAVILSSMSSVRLCRLILR